MEMAGTPTKSCDICGGSFTPESRLHRICSDECRLIRKRERAREQLARYDKQERGEDGLFREWTPTPREILERRIDLHLHYGTVVGNSRDQEIADELKARLASKSYSAEAGEPDEEPICWSVNYLPISDYLLKCLRRAGLLLVGEVAMCSKERLLATGDFDERDVAEIKAAVECVLLSH